MLRDIGHPAGEDEPVYDITYENVQAGERTSHLFRLANHHRALVVGTGDLSELALGWSTYGVGDQMSHYNVNASVPKTLIQFLIRWAIDTDQFGDARRTRCSSPCSRPRSPRSWSPTATRRRPAAAATARASSAPTSCRTSSSTTSLRFGYRPSKVAFLAHHAWHDRDRGDWPDLIPQERRNQYSLAEIKHWLGVFLERFFQHQPVQALGDPNAPKVGLRRLAVAARRLARAERRRRRRVA